MNNYIINTYSKTSLTLTKATVEELKNNTPVGCPFENYTLFDLLMDLIKMYSWKMEHNKKYTINDFLTATNDIAAIAYYENITGLIIE